MSTAYDEVVSLNPGKENWRILVKIIRLWYGQSYNSAKLPSSLELVVIDAKGTKIHIFIKKSLMYKFDRICREGQVFMISCFEVVENTGLFKPTRHGYKVNLQLKTDIRPMNQFPISVDPFTFVPLSEVISPNFDTSYLIDVIGILTGVGTEKEIVTNGKKVRMNVIEIECSGVKMECALFGSYNEQLKLFLLGGEKFNVVIILQYVKAKRFQDIYSLQNVHGATKLMFNPAIAISESVRERYSEGKDNASQSLSQLQDSTKGNADEDFLILTPRRTVAQLNESEEDGCFVFAGTISYVELGHDWWYTACKCNKKVYPDEKMYFCEVCNRHVVTVFPRYRLQLRVFYDTASASVLLFDKEASALVGKSAAELVEKAGDSSGIPPELIELADKKFLFKVEVKPGSVSKFEACRYGTSFKVKKVCSDSAVMEQFASALVGNTVGTTSSRLMTTPSSVLTSGQVTKDLMEEFVVLSTEKNPSTPEFVTIDLNDDTQAILASKRSTSPEIDGNNPCNMKKKKIPGKGKKDKA